MEEQPCPLTKPEDAEYKSTPVYETNNQTKNAQGGWEVVKTAKGKGKKLSCSYQ